MQPRNKKVRKAAKGYKASREFRVRAVNRGRKERLARHDTKEQIDFLYG